MADIRIKDLPLATGGTAPVGTDAVAIDGLTTRRTTITALGNVAVPIASQATAEAGVNATERMVPLTVKQSIASEVGVTLASAANGVLASTALQPGDAATPAQGALADSALQPSDIGTTAGTVAAGDDSRIVGALAAANKATNAQATAGTDTTNYMVPATTKKSIETVALTVDQMSNAETLAAIINRTGLTPQMLGALSSDTNHSPAINAAIDRIITAGGGTLYLPAISGDWKIGSSIQCHKTGFTGSYLKVKGVGDKARLKWLNTTGDAFIIGDGTNPVYYVDFESLYLYAGGGARTSGIDFKFTKANIVTLKDIITDGTFSGIYGEDVNSLYGSLVHINMPNQTIGAGVTIYSNPSGSGRSDIVKFDELTVQAYNAGSYGMIIDGRVAGVHTDGAYMLGTRRGLQLVSSSSSLANIPQFCDFNKFETDRALDISVVVEKAYRTEFRRCEISNTSGAADTPYPQGSADNQAFAILSGAIDTKILGGRIGNCRRQALTIEGKNTKVIGTSLTDMSKIGSNQAAALYLGATANGFNIRDITAEGYSRASVAIQMESATSNGVINGVLYKDTLGGYSAGTGTNVSNTGQVLCNYTY